MRSTYVLWIGLLLFCNLSGFAQKKTSIPKSTEFVTSPLRNRIQLELNAPKEKVWALVGKLERMPEYSAGLKNVDATYGSDLTCKGYTCTFYPMEEGMSEMKHSETIKWFVPNLGYASMANEPNDLGLQQSLGIITLEQKGNSTLLTWSQHFNAPNKEFLKMNLEGFEMALNQDIAKRLIDVFGGRLIESFVDTIE